MDYKERRSYVSAEMVGFALKGDVTVTTVVDGRSNMYMLSYDGRITVSMIDTDVPRELARRVEGHKYDRFEDAWDDVSAVTSQAEAYKTRRSALVHDMTTDSNSVRFHFNENGEKED